MSEQCPDDQKTLPSRRSDASEGMTQIVKSNIAKICPLANAPPHVRHAHEVADPTPGRQDLRTPYDAREVFKNLRRRRRQLHDLRAGLGVW